MLHAHPDPYADYRENQAYPTATNEGNASETTSVKHALVDFAGDDTFEIASAGYGDGVRAIDPRDGKVLWSLSAPMPTCPRVVAVDIDGRLEDHDCTMTYRRGSRKLAVATVFRDQESLKAEAEMEESFR